MTSRYSIGGAQCPAAGDERPVVFDDVAVVDRDVALGGGEVFVAKDLGGDVHGEAGCDGVGGEHAAEVVRGELQWCAVGVAQAAGGGDAVDECPGV